MLQQGCSSVGEAQGMSYQATCSCCWFCAAAQPLAHPPAITCTIVINATLSLNTHGSLCLLLLLLLLLLLQ
jgi:hypothetical protein